MDQIRHRLGVNLKIRVRVAERPEEAAKVLGTLPQVASTEVGDDSISVTMADGSSADGLVAETLVGAGFKLVSLQPEELRLDDAFIALTQGHVQ
jgi:hypothetical protein